LPLISVHQGLVSSIGDLEQPFKESGAGDFQLFLNSATFTELKDNGLLLL
jgi:hypothetical protein